MKEKATILYHYLRTKWRQRQKNRQALEQWHEKTASSHLRFVREHSSFYRELWQGYDETDWRALPIINKEMMMEHFDQLNTAGIRKDDAFAVAYEAERSRNFSPMIGSVTVGLSSGTSGNRGIFLVGRQERRAWAGTVLAKMLPKSILHKERIAFFLRANSNLYNSVGSNRLQFSFYDLLNPVEDHIERLNAQQPGLIVAPPSMLLMLAEAKQLGHLRIEPRKIVSVAEVLDKLDQQRIESQFAQKVHQVYQCTEGFIACTCSYGNLHINEDIVIVEKEYLDKPSGRFVPIITDLSRKVQPIVRYRLNDVLTERAEPCPCGSPFLALEAVEGRCDDVFYMYGLHDNKLQPIFPDFISRAIITASNEVKEYRAVQHAPDQLAISLRFGTHTTRVAEIEQEITRTIHDLCVTKDCKPPNIHFHLSLGGREHKSEMQGDIRKLRRVERRFHVESG